MAKSHNLLKEMRIHIQNSLMIFKEFYKVCQNIKAKPALKLTPETESRKTIVFDMD